MVGALITIERIFGRISGCFLFLFLVQVRFRIWQSAFLIEFSFTLNFIWFQGSRLAEDHRDVKSTYSAEGLDTT